MHQHVWSVIENVDVMMEKYSTRFEGSFWWTMGYVFFFYLAFWY